MNLALQDYESDDWELVESIDLHTEDYTDYRLWKQVNLAQSAAEVQACASHTEIKAHGALTLTARGNQSIDATVLAGSVGVAGGGKTGVGVSGAGVFAQNRIKTGIRASVDGSGSTGISTGSIGLTADDSSAIAADAGAASLAAGVGGKTGVALSVGLSIAQNEISNEVDACISNADMMIVTGDISLQAHVRPTDIDTSDYTTASGIQTLSVGDTVRLADDYANGGEGGRLYAYRGFVADYTNQADFLPTDGLVTLVEGDTVKVGLAIYRYVGADNEGEGVSLYLPSQDYSDDDYWESAELAIHEGNTVQAGNSVYRYAGEDDDLNLGTQAYGGSLWELINPDRRNLGITDYSDTRLWELADGTITSRAVAASIAAGFGGKAGVAVSGAGAVATNVILTTTNAHIENSTVVNAVDIDLDAENSSAITATIAAASIALGAGGKAGVGVSIGVSIAENFIGWDAEGGRSPAEVQAFIRDSSITATGTLTLNAASDSTIDAVVLAGSAAIAAGGTAGVGLSGAGVSATNRIATHIKAYIDGDDDDSVGAAAGISAGVVALHATDASSIEAIAGAATISAAFGGKAGVALSVGVALAENHISNEVEAYIANADDTLESTAGGIVLDARTRAGIDAITAAASVAIGAAGTAGIAVSGAGAVAKNVILTRTNAYIENSVIDSAGAVDLDAESDSAIDATVVAVSAAVGVGGTAGIGASVGFALARNFIGWDPSAPASDYTSAQELKTIPTGTTVRVLDGVRGGDVYRYIGPTVDVYDFTSTDGTRTLQNDDDRQTRVKVGDDIYVWEGDDNESVNLGTQNYQTNGEFDDEGHPEPNEGWRLERVSSLRGQDYGDLDLWKLILPEDIEDASQVQAYVMNSEVTARRGPDARRRGDGLHRRVYSRGLGGNRRGGNGRDRPERRGSRR